MLDLHPAVIDTSNAKHLKINKQIINDCSMSSNKIVGLMHARKWKIVIEPFLINEKEYTVEKLDRVRGEWQEAGRNKTI